jgi:diaminohydroxyphosphoribosylaminopyrimidine deaminase/5-amino-6-(5-phosphoribosylamino)uracil reductase
LTARPPGPRTALRVVLDTRASLPSASRLASTARDVPVLVAVGKQAAAADRTRLEKAGCEVFECMGENHVDRLHFLLEELGRRRLTNVLVEGGGRVLGSFFAARQIDEVHVFIAPQLIGGSAARIPFAGEGIAKMADALRLDSPVVETLDGDVYVRGRVRREGGRGM